MAITRTPLIDDDGSGTLGTVLNNAWLQGLYSQIDVATTPTYGAWTPVDASGAGLVFAYTGGQVAKYGKLVCVWLQVIYPTTAHAGAAVIGGLPYVVRMNGAGTQGFGPFRVWNLPLNTSGLNALDPATGLAQPNSSLSGANLVVSAVYLTD